MLSSKQKGKLQQKQGTQLTDTITPKYFHHKSASDLSLALQHLGTKPKLLPDGKKATLIAVIVSLHYSSFPTNASSTDNLIFASSMASYEEIDEGIKFEVDEV